MAELASPREHRLQERVQCTDKSQHVNGSMQLVHEEAVAKFGTLKPSTLTSDSKTSTNPMIIENRKNWAY